MTAASCGKRENTGKIEDDMTDPDQEEMDKVLKRLLQTPPKPHEPFNKTKPKKEAGARKQ